MLGGPELAHRGRPWPGTTPADQPGPTRVRRADHAGLGVGEQDRHAVGGPDHQGHARARRSPGRRRPVGSAVRPVARRRRPSAPCTWRMPREPVARRRSPSSTRRRFVRDARRRRPRRRAPRLRDVERRGTDPAVPVGEGDVDGAVRVAEGEHAVRIAGLLQEVGHVQVVVVELDLARLRLAGGCWRGRAPAGRLPAPGAAGRAGAAPAGAGCGARPAPARPAAGLPPGSRPGSAAAAARGAGPCPRRAAWASRRRSRPRSR